MDLELKGKVALITGASQGIGLAIAQSMAKEGCDLHLVARDPEKLLAVSREVAQAYGVQVTPHAIDVTHANAIERLMAECPKVDILINNAGNTPRGTLLNLDEKTWRSGWELKIFGYINLTREIYRYMVDRQEGVILNVIGIGSEKLEYAYVAGSMGNAALVAFTKTLGSVSMDHGVRVLGVNPGWVETEKSKKSLKKRALLELGDEELWRDLTREFPRGHLLAPQEVADVVTFACSSKASAISGHVITVDAGFANRGYKPPTVA
jgi:NAD(P)-dependent dehydrogenase (short-subunit alcohol dehydrogenase family)